VGDALTGGAGRSAAGRGEQARGAVKRTVLGRRLLGRAGPMWLAGPSGTGRGRLCQRGGELGRRLPGNWLAGRKQGKEGEEKKNFFSFSNTFSNLIFK